MRFGPEMNRAALWLSPRGRIGRRAYWIGLAPIFVADFALSYIPTYGDVLGVLLLAWPYGCVFAKRLHDLGRSGWFQLMFWTGQGLMTLQAARVAYAEMTQGQAASEALDAALRMSPQAIISMIAGLMLFSLFVTKLGFTPSRRGPNRYGGPAETGPEDLF